MNRILALCSILVLTASCSAEPEACYELEKQTFSVNEEVHFLNCSRNAEQVEWDFGDGNRSESALPTHRYQESGHYTSVLRTYNDAGEDDFTFNIDVGFYFLKSLNIDSTSDTVTGPREYKCHNLYLTHNYDGFTQSYGANCFDEFSIVEQAIPSQPNLSFIHYYYVLNDTGANVWDNGKIVYDTLYADSNVLINLDKQRSYNDLHFYGSGVNIVADIEFDFRVDN